MSLHKRALLHCSREHYCTAQESTIALLKRALFHSNEQYFAQKNFARKSSVWLNINVPLKSICWLNIKAPRKSSTWLNIKAPRNPRIPHQRGRMLQLYFATICAREPGFLGSLGTQKNCPSACATGDWA